MRSAKSAIAVGFLLVQTFLTGCHYSDWESIKVGRSSANDVSAIFKTPVAAEDRYAYAIDRDPSSGRTELIMTNFDDDGIVSGKFYWHWDPRPVFALTRLDSWEIAMQTQVAPLKLQEYSATLGPREEAVLEHFGEILIDTVGHFEHLSEIFGAAGSMRKIFTLASVEYSMRADKQSLLSEDGFVFDGDIYGHKCTMVLMPLDERSGLYEVVLKGHRTKNFFSGW